MESFEQLLEKSTSVHGHLCPGQVLGVRMSMLGLARIGIDEPRGKDRKNLLVYVEIDRCATDAVQSVTGCSLGHRTLKWMDYGIMAATFVNLATKQAVRVTAREEAREAAKTYGPPLVDKYRQQLEAYRVMPDHELFKIQEVAVDIPPQDLPGRPMKRVCCQRCGDFVQDGREVEQDIMVLCRGCARGRYYRVLSPEK